MNAPRSNIRSVTVHPAQPARMPVTDAAPAARDAMRIFAVIPPRYGVIAIHGDSTMFKVGEVAVYDELWSHEPVQDGAIYVIEYQHPPAGMSWEIYDRINSKALLTVSRSVVRLERCRRNPDEWYFHPLAARENGVALVCSDGPIPDWRIGHNIIGKVVGLYNPATLSGEAVA